MFITKFVVVCEVEGLRTRWERWNELVTQVLNSFFILQYKICCLQFCCQWQNTKYSMNQGRSEEIICSICLSSLLNLQQPTSQLVCQHTFHTTCIQTWEKKCRASGKSIRCPNCRKHLLYKVEPQFPSQQNLPAPQAIPHFIIRHADHQQLCCHGYWLLLVTLLTLGIEAALLYFYIISMRQAFQDPKGLPIFSAGMFAKGYIAIGMFAEGFLAIGMLGQGMVNVSLIGIGVVFFVGQIGGGIGYGVYQIGISGICRLGQLSIGIWQTKEAQMGLSLLAPLFYPQKKHCIS